MSKPTPARPRVALAMAPAVAEQLFGARWDELEACCDLLSRVPLATFDGAAASRVLHDTDVLLTGWGVPVVDADVLRRAPNLAAIVHAAGTIKGFVGDACWDRGVRVTSVAAANAVPVAEFTVAAIVLANKGAFLARERYRADHRGLPWNVTVPTPGNRGKRIGIVGASRVGRLVIQLLGRDDNEVLLYDPIVTADEAAALGVIPTGLDQLLSTCDVVSVHAPLLPATVGLIDRRRLALMRDGATLVNTARGAIVDGAALEDELRSGRLNAVIDTTDPEPLPDGSALYDLPNVFLTPHIAGSVGTELSRLAEAAIAELQRYADGIEFVHAIAREDLPWIA